MPAGQDDIGRRWAGGAGLVSVALAIPSAVVVLLAGDYPEPGAPADEVVDYLRENRTPYLFALFTEAIRYGFFVWFLHGLRDRLVLVAGTAFALMIMAEDAALAAIANLADDGSAGTIAGLRELGFQVAWPFSRPFAVVALVGAVVAFRSVWPAWLTRFTIGTAALNAAFVGSVFVERGAWAPGGLAPHLLATAPFELWVVAVSALLLGLVPARR